MEKKNNAYGIISLIIGILSNLLFLLPYFGLPMGILAIVFSNKQKKFYENGLATGGLVTGIIGVVINTITLLFLLIILLIASTV